MTDATGDLTISTRPKRGIRRRLVIAVSLALVVAAAVASLFIVRGVDTQMNDVQGTYEVRRLARDLVQSLTDAETGQRGFLLTLDEAYLEPYRDAVATIDTIYRALSEMVGDIPEQERRIASLVEPITQKRTEMATTISMAMEGRVNEAMTVMRSDAGRALMDTIRATLGDVVAEEDARLLERNGGVAVLRSLLVAMIVVALGAAALLTYMLFMRTQRDVSKLSRTHTELQSQNIELENRVRERTSELEEARAHAERERARVEALLQETNHRIGNSLATVSSLLGLQVTRTRSEEVRHALEAAQNRVQAIASGHRRLRLGADLETANAAEFLSAVIEDLQTTQAVGRNVTLDTSIEDLTINARDATTLGIVVGELVINALKHAFAEEQSGRMCVILKAAEFDGVILEVEDDGRGMPAEGERDERGLGGMIIKQLSRQFGGEVRYEAREGGGTRVTVLLPEFEIVGRAVERQEPGAPVAS